MDKLQAQWQRLYAASAAAQGAQVAVRAMVLELARPAEWTAVATVWHAVQVEMQLPAPAIAVCGPDGYQLWFSVAQPVPPAQARRFLDALRLRFWGDVKPERVRLLLQGDGSSAAVCRQVPAPLAQEGTWSAFVAPDLAPVFTEEPWLDGPPNPDGQAELLARLDPMPLADFEQALRRLEVDAAPSHPAAHADSVPAHGSVDSRSSSAMAQVGAHPGPRLFLLEVMNNDAVPLALRIDAAKALLPYLND